MSKKRHGVSDYALLRYIEVQHGIEITSLRAMVSRRADAGGKPCEGMKSLRVGGLRFHISGGTVCDVAPADAEPDET